MLKNPDLYLLLYNVRSAHNVGAIFRTAEAAGVKEIILFGYTPQPIDRFGRVRKDIHKAALDAESFVPWRHEEDIEKVFSDVKQRGIEIVVVEQTKDAVLYDEYPITKPTLFVMGNEREGVPEDVWGKADRVVFLPMKGRKESLNVSVATGIVLFSALSRKY